MWFSLIKSSRSNWFLLLKDKNYYIANELITEAQVKQLWDEAVPDSPFVVSADRDKWPMAKEGKVEYHVAYSKDEQEYGHDKFLGYSGINIKDDAVFSGAIAVVPDIDIQGVGTALFKHKMDYIDTNYKDKYFVTHFSRMGNTIDKDEESMERYINASMFQDLMIYWPDRELEVMVSKIDLDPKIIESGINYANTKNIPFGIRMPLGEIEEPTGEETRISAKPDKPEMDLETYRYLLGQGFEQE